MIYIDLLFTTEKGHFKQNQSLCVNREVIMTETW